MNFLTGVIIIACGIFVCVYGTLLFRFTLAALGFGIGAILGWWLTGDQSDMIRVLISLAVGGILGGALYMLVRIGIYIAGGIFGLVIATLLISLLGLNNVVMDVVLLVGGTGLAGFFGPRLGRSIIALASAAAGAFQIVYGLAMIFAEKITPGLTPTDLLGEPLALAIFLVVGALSVLSQLGPRSRFVRTAR